MHYFISCFFCYARISPTVSSLVCLFITLESRALFHLFFVCLLREDLLHCFISRLFFCYARISCTVSSLVSLFITMESRALFHLLFVYLLRKNLRHCFLSCSVCLLRKNLVHCFFSGLFVGYAKMSRTVSSLVCLFVTQESRALFPLLFVFLLSKNLAHWLMSCLFVCYARISRTISSLACLLRENLVHCFLACLFVTRESRALFPLLFVCLFVCLLRKNLVHCFFSGWFVCFMRISHTALSLFCFFATRESRAHCRLWCVCLLRKNLAHYFMAALFFFCYAKIPRSVSCLVCMFVTKEYDTPILLCRLWFVCLLRKNLAHYFMAASFFSLRENPAQCFMSGLFVCYARISQILFFWFVCLFAFSRNSKHFFQRYREKYSSFNTDNHFLDLQN